MVSETRRVLFLSVRLELLFGGNRRAQTPRHKRDFQRKIKLALSLLRLYQKPGNPVPLRFGMDLENNNRGKKKEKINNNNKYGADY
jgi:hypothetical protein